LTSSHGDPAVPSEPLRKASECSRNLCPLMSTLSGHEWTFERRCKIDVNDPSATCPSFAGVLVPVLFPGGVGCCPISDHLGHSLFSLRTVHRRSRETCGGAPGRFPSDRAWQ